MAFWVLGVFVKLKSVLLVPQQQKVSTGSNLHSDMEGKGKEEQTDEKVFFWVV